MKSISMRAMLVQRMHCGLVALVIGSCIGSVSCTGIPRGDQMPRRASALHTRLSLLEVEEKIIEILGPKTDRRNVVRFEVSPTGRWVSVVMTAKFGMADPGGRGDEIYVIDVYRERIWSFWGSGVSWAPQVDILWSIDTSGRLVVFDGRGNGSMRSSILEGLSLTIHGNFTLFGEVTPLSTSSGIALGYLPEKMEHFVLGATSPLVCSVSGLELGGCSEVGAEENWFWITPLDSQRAVVITWGGGGREGEIFKVLGLEGATVEEAFDVELPSSVVSAAAVRGGTEGEVFVATVLDRGEISPALFTLDWGSDSLRRLDDRASGCGTGFPLGSPGIEAIRRSGEVWELLLDRVPGGGPRYFRIDREGRVICE